jgi:uncharacterized protein (DUF1810 family)
MPQPDLTTNRFNLQRFISAQEPLYAAALAELTAGRKRTHWMWFVFPEVDGLGHSSMARQYAIRSRDEAIAYLATPLLGARLTECTNTVLAVPEKSAHEIFGSPDDLKFHSSMTLFDSVDRGRLYGQALNRLFNGKPDNATLDILKRWDQGA